MEQIRKIMKSFSYKAYRNTYILYVFNCLLLIKIVYNEFVNRKTSESRCIKIIVKGTLTLTTYRQSMIKACQKISKPVSNN